MKFKTTVAPIVVLGLTMSLGGCLGSGSGGGGGGGGGGSSSDQYEAAFAEVQGRVPTSDMPTSINANYQGQFKLGVSSGDAGLLGGSVDPTNAEIIGDLDIDVAWTDGQSNNPFSGTASNIVATDVVSGQSVTLTGSLSVDDSQPYILERQTTTVPVVGEVQTGVFLMTMTGDLQNDAEEGYVYLGMNGQFFGPQGNGMVGGVNGGVYDNDNLSQQVFDAAVGGTMYLSR